MFVVLHASCEKDTEHQPIHCRHLAQENRYMHPKIFLSNEVRMRRQTVFDNEQWLDLWKKHVCTLTVGRDARLVRVCYKVGTGIVTVININSDEMI
jgi:hypothetical protein